MAARAPTILPAISRYLLREFVGLLAPIVAGFVLLYVLVDFFDRLDVLLKNHATLGQTARYFVFKIPLVVTQTVPPAVLTALILTLGTLSRRNEIIALRASGVSLGQMALPLIAAAAVMSLAVLVWSETVVPYSTRRFEHINNVEIRKREMKGLLSDREIWYHGTDGFYNIDYVDARRATVFGLTIYRTDGTMRLQTITQIASARWSEGRWTTTAATVRTVTPDGAIAAEVLPPDRVVIRESLEDFLEVHREPEELSYFALRQRIQQLTRKGIDASSYFVDLQMKLAVPFTVFVLACVAVPLAGRVRRHPSVAATLGIGILVGFGYWVLLALTRSLGQAGALPPLAAAWAANGIYLLLGCGLFLTRE
jgi:lipopolysaccharide export system permease protein